MKTPFHIVFAFFSVLALFGCEKVFFDPEPASNPEAVFEDLWNTFDTYYANFDQRGVDWDAQYDLYRPQVTPTTSADELAGIIEQMLATLDDGHVSMIRPNAPVFYANQIVREKIDHDLFDLDLIETNYLSEAFRENGEGGNLYGWIGEVGYLHLRYIGTNMLDIGAILDYFATARGLIIDLRHNNGGDFTYAYSEFGRFTDEARYVHRSRTKSGPGPDDYYEWFEWWVKPSGQYFDKPIILLTDRYTISAGERITMAFNVLPNVTHLGEPTNGAFSTKIGKELANGWYYYVATQQIRFEDGQDYEGPGMPPDVFVKNTREEMAAGTDKCLEMALGYF